MKIFNTKTFIAVGLCALALINPTEASALRKVVGAKCDATNKCGAGEYCDATSNKCALVAVGTICGGQGKASCGSKFYCPPAPPATPTADRKCAALLLGFACNSQNNGCPTGSQCKIDATAFNTAWKDATKNNYLKDVPTDIVDANKGTCAKAHP